MRKSSPKAIHSYKRKKAYQLPFLFIFLLILIGGLVLSLAFIKKNSDDRSKAAVNAPCTTSFGNNVRVSSNGVEYAESTTIPQSVTRYYVRTGSNCTTALDVLINGQVVENWGSKPWGVYVTDNQGIARIDFDTIPTGKYTAQLKPHGLNVPWSNAFTVEVIATSNPDTSRQEIQLSDYWPTQSGYSYIFNNRNTFTNSTGQSRIVLEEATDWCGNTVIPWQFTKDHPAAYWGQTIPGLGGEGGTVIRWMMTDPKTSPAGTNYNNWIAYTGHKLYNTINLQEVKSSLPASLSRQYQTFDPQVPAYGIGKKTLSVPSKEYISKAQYGLITNDQTCPTIFNAQAQMPETHDGWALRYEFEEINIAANTPGEFSYKGPALRIDFYEYNDKNNDYNFASAGGHQSRFFRETWYLVKNVGPVQIIGGTYNGFGGLPICANNTYSVENGVGCTKDCSKDADCFANRISEPTYVTTLKKFYRNPQLKVAVSTNPTAPLGSEVTIKQGEPYYLKVDVITDSNNPVAYPYTGFLEAQLVGGSPTKWYWADNGEVYIPSSVTKDIAPNRFTAAFRIWVPDANFPNETKVGDTAVPWSNQITVSIQPAVGAAAEPAKTVTQPPAAVVAPTPTPTPTTIKFRILRILRNQRSGSTGNGPSVQ